MHDASPHLLMADCNATKSEGSAADIYHAVEVKAMPGLIARTRDGYYVQP
jgi:hypothetical protein